MVVAPDLPGLFRGWYRILVRLWSGSFWGRMGLMSDAAVINVHLIAGAVFIVLLLVGLFWPVRCRGCDGKGCVRCGGKGRF